MRIYSVSNISFQSLKFHRDGKVKLFNPFFHSVNDQNTPALTTTIEKVNDSFYKTKFYYDDDDTVLASSNSYIVPSKKFIHVANMSTDEAKRHLGLGSGLHLLHVVEMMENDDIDEITLSSTSSAIPFHIKFGFYPCGDYIWALRENLMCICEEDNPKLQKYVDAAKAILVSHDKLKDKEAMANKLLYEYTRAAIAENKDFEYFFSVFVPMTLKKETVIKNRSFYNKLFEKYDIDYKIGPEVK